jgi:hypothetical protein
MLYENGNYMFILMDFKNTCFFILGFIIQQLTTNRLCVIHYCSIAKLIVSLNCKLYACHLFVDNFLFEMYDKAK